MILKQCSAVVLLVSFMAQVLSSPFIVFDYYVNTAAYEKKCINKAKPELHCNGKCQMAKELKQQEEREQQHPGNEHSYKSVVSLFASCCFASAPAVALLSTIRVFPVFNDRYTKDVSLPVFHPPAAQHSFI